MIKNKIYYIVFLFFITYGCSSILPGINIDPSPRKDTSNKTEISIEKSTINLISLNELTPKQIQEYNNLRPKNEKINEVAKFKEIYEYKYNYTLGPGDVIDIKFLTNADSSGVFTINSDGYVEIPYVGLVDLNNSTIQESKKKILEAAIKFYKNPEFQIDIKEFNSSTVYLLGAVRKPLSLKMTLSPITLLDLVSKGSEGSGVSNFSELDYNNNNAYLRRDGQVYEINIINASLNKDTKENFFLKKGDIVFIDKNSDGVFVLGEFDKPGFYVPGRNHSLTQLISTRVVNQLTANMKKIYVIRENTNKSFYVDVFHLNADNPTNLIAANNFILKPNDIVLIQPAELTKWNRVISLLVPQANIINSYRDAGNK